jgi:hypothetical protein
VFNSHPPSQETYPRANAIFSAENRKHAQPCVSLPLFLYFAGPAAVRSAAGAQTAVTGVVVDQLGGAIAGATIAVRNQAGEPFATVVAAASGAFTLTELTPGRCQVEVSHPLFESAATSVEIVLNDAAPFLRITLRIAGLVESMVVTGRRVETRLSEMPQKIEIVAAEDIERSVAADITDVLKKNAGVDVVQYNGVLSGIGMRGFRPEISGINKRSLLLIDGRPSGVTNLATLLLGNVDHIEVLKGAGVSRLRGVGDGRRGQRRHATVTRAGQRGRGRRARQLRRHGVRRQGRRQSVPAPRLRSERQHVQPA